MLRKTARCWEWVGSGTFLNPDITRELRRAGTWVRKPRLQSEYRRLEEPPRRAKKELPAEGIVVSSTSAGTEDTKPKKAGWWQRGFFGG